MRGVCLLFAPIHLFIWLLWLSTKIIGCQLMSLDWGGDSYAVRLMQKREVWIRPEVLLRVFLPAFPSYLFVSCPIAIKAEKPRKSILKNNILWIKRLLCTCVDMYLMVPVYHLLLTCSTKLQFVIHSPSDASSFVPVIVACLNWFCEALPVHLWTSGTF